MRRFWCARDECARRPDYCPNSIGDRIGVVGLRRSAIKVDRTSVCERRTAAFDPDVWSGRTVQEDFDDPADAVLHQCIRPRLGAQCSGPSWVSARNAIWLADRPRTGHLGHQGSHAPGRPILHIVVSSSRRPWRVRCRYVIDGSSLRAVPLFVPGGRSFVPASARRRAARKGPSRPAVVLS